MSEASEAPAREPDDVRHPLWQYLWFYGWFDVGGILCLILILTVILTPAMSRRAVSRHPTVVNLWVVWVFSAIIDSLLLFSGTWKSIEQPHNLCWAQGAMMLCIPTLIAGAVFSLTLRIFLLMLSSRRGKRPPASPLYVGTLVALPWVLFAGLTTANAVWGASHQDQIQRQVLYCVISNGGIMPFISMAIAGILLLVSTLFILLATFLVTRKWSSFRIKRKSERLFVLRVLPFTIYALFAAITAVINSSMFTGYIDDLILCTAGVVIWLSFGTSADMLRAQIGWAMPNSFSTTLARIEKENNRESSTTELSAITQDSAFLDTVDPYATRPMSERVLAHGDPFHRFAELNRTRGTTPGRRGSLAPPVLPDTARLSPLPFARGPTGTGTSATASGGTLERAPSLPVLLPWSSRTDTEPDSELSYSYSHALEQAKEKEKRKLAGLDVGGQARRPKTPTVTWSDDSFRSASSRHAAVSFSRERPSLGSLPPDWGPADRQGGGQTSSSPALSLGSQGQSGCTGPRPERANFLDLESTPPEGAQEALMDELGRGP